MFKKTIFSAVLTCSLASAGVITIDDFSTDQAQLSLATAGGSIASTVGNRTITLNGLGSVAPISRTVEVTTGVLDVTNGTGDDSQIVIDWVLGALPVPVGATNLQLSFVVIGSDANPTSIAASGLASGNFSIPGNTSNQTISFGIAGTTFGPGTLTLTIDGQPGWDLTLDSLDLSYTDPVVTAVPEPSTYALFSAGALAVGLLRRRRK